MLFYINCDIILVYQVGDIFADHYCYGDTSVNFHQVVRKTAKKVVFEAIEKAGNMDYPKFPTVSKKDCKQLMSSISCVSNNGGIFIKRPKTNYMTNWNK